MTSFKCEKRSVSASAGMVVTSHHLGSGAGAEMLLAGGNAVDAAVASLFALTVVEPGMVGILGGGLMHIRLASGRHVVLDGLGSAPQGARADMYELVSPSEPACDETVGRRNATGPSSIATPGALASWCQALEQFGSLPLATVMQPAIRLANDGYRLTPYLSDNIEDVVHDMQQDRYLLDLYVPNGRPAPAGTVIRQPVYAATLQLIATEGASVLYRGELGAALANYIRASGCALNQDDLAAYKVSVSEPIRGSYRGYEVTLPGPTSAGVHILQMLKLLEGYDIGALGFDSPHRAHLLVEAMKMAFADRAALSYPEGKAQDLIARLVSTEYADKRRKQLDPDVSKDWGAIPKTHDSPHTTHLTVADQFGNVVAATQTITSTFGACCTVPGTGLVLNNHMMNFDLVPGRSLSIMPGKRVFTAMSPTIMLKDGKPALALGLSGGLRIFTSVLQSILNVVDHGMAVHDAVEAPRIWARGKQVDIEHGMLPEITETLRSRGHMVIEKPSIGGGMNAISFHPEGEMRGASCWRADGTPIGIGGGLARPGTRFPSL